jgi:hypothetical protein
MGETWVARLLWKKPPLVNTPSSPRWLFGSGTPAQADGRSPGMRSAYWGPAGEIRNRFSVRPLRSSPACVMFDYNGRLYQIEGTSLSSGNDAMADAIRFAQSAIFTDGAPNRARTM